MTKLNSFKNLVFNKLLLLAAATTSLGIVETLGGKTIPSLKLLHLEANRCSSVKSTYASLVNVMNAMTCLKRQKPP